MHSNPQRSLEYYNVNGVQFMKDDLDIDVLYKWRVPAQKKANIIREMSGLGITQRTVFPDLGGVARSLWETEVLWKDPKG